MKKILTALPGALLLTIALAGFPVMDSNAADSHIRPIKIPYPAHEFRLKDLDDKWISLKDLRGKTVIINFWATWCPPCRKELPSMQRTYKKYKNEKFVILGINVGESWDVIAPFLTPLNIEFPILLDTDSSELAIWKAIGLPTSFVINGQGMVTHRFTGGRDWDDPVFRKDLEKILAAN